MFKFKKKITVKDTLFEARGSIWRRIHDNVSFTVIKFFKFKRAPCLSVTPGTNLTQVTRGLGGSVSLGYPFA